MAETSEISWTDATFNPWIGCTRVSPACDHCYAERDFDLRKGVAKWGAGNPRHRTSHANWKKPLQWNAKRFMECGECGWRGECAAELIGCGRCGSISSMNGTRRRVFCASLADVFDNEVPEQWRADLFYLIRQTPNLDWLLLTKRIGNVWSMTQRAMWSIGMRPGMHHSLPENVWLGASIVNQKEAERDIPKLLTVPARGRFVSMEPLLGPVDLCKVDPLWSGARLTDGTRWTRTSGKLDWVIVGGESGPSARPMHPQWARSLRDQCDAAGVPFHFKQWGEWGPIKLPSVRDAHPWPRGPFNADVAAWSYLVGKKAAGRLLDGVEHNGFPVTAN